MSIYKSPTMWTGNTYPARDEIKALGGRWDAKEKGWRVPALSMAKRSQASSIAHRYGLHVYIL